MNESCTGVAAWPRGCVCVCGWVGAVVAVGSAECEPD